MKRACVVLLTLIICSGVLFAGCGGSEPEPAASSEQPQPDKVYELTYALFQPEVAALSVMNTEFAREIERRTNGRVKITVHAGGSLLGAPAMYQGILDGVADMGNGISSYDPGAFPFTSIAELPSKAQSGWVVSNALYDFMEKYQPEEWSEIHMLTAVSTAADFQALCMGKKQLKTMADWRGVSIRTNHADIVQAMGGTVKDIPMADVYDALSKGVVDGVMGAAEPLASWRLGEVCDWVTINPAPVQPSILWYNIMNLDTWDSLPEDIQQIITEVGREYSGKLGLTWDDQGVAGIEFSLAQGKTVYILPDDEAAKWTAAVEPIVDKRLATVAESSGLSEEEVKSIWDYFQGRVDYWNGQQESSSVTPVVDRIRALVEK